MKQTFERRRMHYIHYLSYSAQERIVGVFMLLALAFVFGLLFAKGRSANLFEHRVIYHAYLENAQGVSTETRVKISGIEVGRVTSVDISADNKIHITFFVFKRFHNLVREDSKAALSKLSIIGSATLEISAGSPDSPPVPERARIEVAEPESIDDLIERVSPVITQLAEAIDGISTIVAAIDAKDVSRSSTGLADGISDLQKITHQLAAGEGAVGQLLFDEKTKADVTQSLSLLRESLKQSNQRLSELEPTLRDLRQTSQALPALVADLSRLSAGMNSAMETVNVQLQTLPDLVSRMQGLMQEADRTVYGVQQVWPLSEALGTDTQPHLIAPQPGYE